MTRLLTVMMMIGVLLAAGCMTTDRHGSYSDRGTSSGSCH